MTIIKTCTTCNASKPLSDYHKQKSQRDGHRHMCKNCRKHHTVPRPRKDPLLIKQEHSERKKKWYVKNKARILQERKQYRADNLPSILARGRAFYHENKDEIAVKSREYYRENREAIRAKGRDYHIKNKAKNNARTSKWKKENHGHVIAEATKRKARIRIATPRWFENTAVNTVYEKAADRHWHVDHIVPLTSDIVCGLHCHANLQLLEPRVNLQKHNRHWPDMPGETI